jgi:hypothetical protein
MQVSQQTRAPEVPIFEDTAVGVYVTTTRVQIGNTTYALANITSVRHFTEPRPRWLLYLGIPIMLVGLPQLVDHGSPGVALIVGVVMIIAFFGMNPKHWVRIGTAGAEANAVFSSRAAWTARVVAAINEAIVRRG